MEKALAFLRRFGWTVFEFDCRVYDSQERIYNAVLRALGNRPADYWYKDIQHIQFWDLLRDINVSMSVGINLAFKHVDDLNRTSPDCVQSLVQSIAGEHLYRLRRGQYLTACVHLQDPSITFEPRTVVTAEWNKTHHWTDEEVAEGRAKMANLLADGQEKRAARRAQGKRG